MKQYMAEKRANSELQLPMQSCGSKQKKNKYMKQYMTKKRASSECQPSIKSPESKQKKKKYMKQYMAEKRASSKFHFMTQKTQPKCELAALIAKFHDIVSQGPLYVCTCCDQLWYRHSVISASTIKESNPDIEAKLLNKKSVNNIEWLCKTCNKHLKANKVPACAAINGMQFPLKPSFFYLNELECRLVAPRLAFQKIMQAPRGKQLKINGNSVNVPADVGNTVSMLSRLPSETNTIKVNLKRRLQYKSSALSLNVRSHKVTEAARWLVRNGNLYQEE